MNVLVQRASELPPKVKSAVEELLGRSIDGNEEVSIASIPAQQILPSGNRLAMAQKLEAFLGRRAEKVQEVSDEELDATIDEAVDHVRHGRV